MNKQVLGQWEHLIAHEKALRVNVSVRLGDSVRSTD